MRKRRIGSLCLLLALCLTACAEKPVESVEDSVFAGTEDPSVNGTETVTDIPAESTPEAGTAPAKETAAAPTETEAPDPDGGRTYIWEKEGFGGDFLLSLWNDGCYTYYAGSLSSYIGYGHWKEENGIVTMKEYEDSRLVFRFARDGEDLVYIASGSASFLYVQVKDGDRFLYTTEKEGIRVNNVPENNDPAQAIRPRATLVIVVNDRCFYAGLEDNPSAAAFVEKLSPQALQLDMRDYGGFEKVGELPWTLPRTDTRITAVPGDVILYQGNQLTIYYGENTWEFTRLAHIGNVEAEELRKVLGSGNVTVKLSLEWDE